MIKKVKKVVKSNMVKPKKSSDEDIRFIQLCESHIIYGLNFYFVSTTENGEIGNLIFITMKDKVVAHYELFEADKAFWPIMKKLEKVVNKKPHEERA